MVFIVVSIVSWDWFVTSAPSWRRWVSPLALGLAISIQQDSWFLVPCFLVAAYQEAKALELDPWRTAVRYISVVAAAFLAINLPFIAMGPSAYVHGILEPLTLSLMPLGQGLIGLTTYLGIGGGDLSLYSVTSLIVLATLVLALGFHYRRTRFLVPIAPAIVLWFSTRSLSQYVLIAAFALLAAMCCWKPLPTHVPPEMSLRARHRRHRWPRPDRVGLIGGISVVGALLIAISSVAAVGALTVALTSKAPLTLQVLSYHSTGQEQTVDSLIIQVRNNADVAKRPVYVVENGPYVGTPWLVTGSQPAIPAHSVRTVKILAPNTSVMPSLNSAFTVAGFTSGPAAVSTSASFLPDDFHTLLTPFGFPGVLPVGKSVTVQVEVLNRLGAPVRASGIEVQLGQEVYSPVGLFATENSINGHADGESPVGAKTNSQGVATFHVRADQAQTAATTLQAWLGKSGASGYSNRVIAWFGYPHDKGSAATVPGVVRAGGAG